MTSDAVDVVVELQRMIADGRISEEALQAVTGIASTTLRRFLEVGSSGMAAIGDPQAELSVEEGLRLSVLAAQLTEGLQIADDDRLRGIFESLTIECGLTFANIAGLTGLDVDDVDRALREPEALPGEKKYALATRGAYLLGAIGRARVQGI